jgi:threonine synthase
MDVGDPSNFARILDLYDSDLERIRRDITAYSFTDEVISECIGRVYGATGYVLEPHGACAWLGLEEGLRPGEQGLMLETAHPAKFPASVEPVIGRKVEIPDTLSHFLSGEKHSVAMSAEFGDFKKWLEKRL